MNNALFKFPPSSFIGVMVLPIAIPIGNQSHKSGGCIPLFNWVGRAGLLTVCNSGFMLEKLLCIERFVLFNAGNFAVKQVVLGAFIGFYEACN